MKNYPEKLQELFYPNTCPFCGRVTGTSICSACRKRLPYIEGPRCMRCGKPVRQESQEYCADCAGHPAYYERGYALWLHQGAVKEAIYQFKYHNRRIYGRSFAEELLAEYEATIRRWNITTIIPIPLSKKKRRLRGYNQAEILARELGRALDIPVNTRDFLRVKHTHPQKQMDVRQRQANLSHAFAWRKGSPLSGNVLLVDDIYTTGSTVNHAARVLKQAGARKVYFLTISIGQGN